MQPGYNCSRCSQCLFILKAYSIKDPHLELRAKWKAHDWRGHGLSGDAATTALLQRWNLLGKHLLNTSVDTCRLLLQPASASHKTDDCCSGILLNAQSQMEETNPRSTSAPPRLKGNAKGKAERKEELDDGVQGCVEISY